MFQTTVGGNAFFGADGLVSVHLMPGLSLGMGVAYNHYASRGNPLFEAAGVVLEVSYRPGAGPRPAEIEIIPIDLSPIFPVFYKYYDDHPVGRVMIENRAATAVQDLKVSFFIEQYMTNPKLCAVVPQLRSGDKFEADLLALLSNKVLELTEDTKVLAAVQLDYQHSGESFTAEQVESVRVYHRNAMTWDDDKKAAAFVTAKDPTVLRFSKQVAGVVRNVGRTTINTTFRIAICMFEALAAHGMSYVIDPTTPYIELSQSAFALDYLAFPRQSLDYRAGDCDDLSILFTALLQSVGIETAFITVPEHIYAAFSLGIAPELAKRIFLNPQDLIFDDGDTWIPVEITMVKDGFLEAWQTGARQWRENLENNAAVLHPISEAWKLYEPVGLPGDELRVDMPEVSEIQDRYVAVLNDFIEQEISPRIVKLQELIERSKNNVREINRLGLLYARYGLIEKAKAEFSRVLAIEEYLPSLVNMGNIHFAQREIDQALEYYNRAAELAPDNGSVLLCVARANYEKENFPSVQKAYSRLSEVQPKLAEKYAYLVTRVEDVVRASEVFKEDLLWQEE